MKRETALVKGCQQSARSLPSALIGWKHVDDVTRVVIEEDRGTGTDQFSTLTLYRDDNQKLSEWFLSGYMVNTDQKKPMVVTAN
jgi:hypothetical protein